MKGVELPINTLIIVVIAMVVLLAVLAMIFGVWPIGSQTVSLQAATSAACQMLLATGCNMPEEIYVENFDADKDGQFDQGGRSGECNYQTELLVQPDDNLYMLCKCWYGEDDPVECKEIVCKCPEQ